MGLLVLLVTWQLLVSPPHVFDEQHYLAQAWRVAQGELLYRDVWEFNTPVPIFIVAAGYWLTGLPSLEMGRLVAAIFAGLLLCSLAYCARMGGATPNQSILASVGVAMGCFPVYRAIYHHWISWGVLVLALAIASKAIHLAHESKLARGHWFAAGLAVGLASLCTQSQLVVGGAALFVAALLLWLQQIAAWRDFGMRLLCCGAGMLLPWLVLILAYATQGAATQMLYQVWLWPMSHYRVPGSGNEVWPFTDIGSYFFPYEQQALSPKAWFFALWAGVGSAALPVLAALGALVGLVVGVTAWVRGEVFSPRAQVALMWAVVTLLAGVMVFQGRSDYVHFRVAAIPAWAAWAMWSAHLHRVGLATQKRSAMASVRVPALLLALFVGVVTVAELRSFRKAWREGHLAFPLTPLSRDSEAMKTLRAWLPPGGRLAVYPGSGVPYLFGGGRPSSRYTTLTPPSYRYHDAQNYQEFREDLAKHPPDVVVLVHRELAQAVAEMGGQPDYRDYREVARCHGPPGEQVIYYRFLVRKGIRQPHPRP